MKKNEQKPTPPPPVDDVPYSATVPITMSLMIQLEQIIGTKTLFEIGTEMNAEVTFDQKERLRELLRIESDAIEDVEYELKVFFYRYSQHLQLASKRFELFQLSALYSKLTAPLSALASELTTRSRKAGFFGTGSSRRVKRLKSEGRSAK